MSAPRPDATATAAPRRRRGPLALLGLAVVVLAAVWLGIEIWLHLMGIATSPLGWLLSAIGALASVFSARGG